jgi:hypothetical protein
MKKTLIYTSIIAIALGSCTKSQFSSPTYSTGKANFSTMISVGNSLTQGFMDGGLYAYGQSNSYPSIIAKQINLVTKINFQQPMVTGNGSGYIHLVYLNGAITPIQPGDDSTAGPNPADADPSWNNWGASLTGNSYNNLGIAGIVLNNCVALNSSQATINNLICGGYGNPYGRFMNFGSPLAANPIQYINFIRSSKATFFTCWLGNNDVLGYAINGGVPESETITGIGTVTVDEITPPAEFAQKYDSILIAFHNLGAQGVCATIPDVTSIPYFNTVPSYITVNGAKQYLWITTAVGVRQATNADYIILPEYTAVEAGQGIYQSDPVPNDMVLDASEVDSVEIATNAYNASIKSLAASFGYPVVDMHSFLTSLTASITIDGITLTRQFVQGGAFGLDGIHPTAIGYALIANQFIAQINATYGATIPPADVSEYRGELFPSF